MINEQFHIKISTMFFFYSFYFFFFFTFFFPPTLSLSHFFVFSLSFLNSFSLSLFLFLFLMFLYIPFSFPFFFSLIAFVDSIFLLLKSFFIFLITVIFNSKFFSLSLSLSLSLAFFPICPYLFLVKYIWKASENSPSKSNQPMKNNWFKTLSHYLRFHLLTNPNLCSTFLSISLTNYYLLNLALIFSLDF